MSREITIVTPEHVELTFELAGLGSRFLAAFVDTLLQGLTTLLLTLGLWLIPPRGLPQPNTLTPWMIAVSVLLLYALWGAYFLLFETVWNGQTPGKRSVDIRVIRDSGHPIDFRAALLRNVMRAVDFLPGSYGVGFISIFLSPQYRRLGDYVAGTLVVKTGKAKQVEWAPANSATTDHPSGIPASAPLAPEAPEYQSLLPEEALLYLHTIHRDDCRAIRHFLDRRRELEPGIIRSLALKLAQPLAGKLHVDLASFEDPVVFLERLSREWERRMAR